MKIKVMKVEVERELEHRSVAEAKLARHRQGGQPNTASLTALALAIPMNDSIGIGIGSSVSSR